MAKIKLEQIWGDLAKKNLEHRLYRNRDLRNIKLFTEKELKGPNINPMIKELHKHKPRGRKILLLDAGCGLGFFTIYAEKLGYSAVGIDISKESISLAKELAKMNRAKATFLVGDVRNLPFNNEKFDVVLSGGVIEHFKDTETAVKEHSRVLKKGGLFIGDVPYRYSIFVINKLFQKLIGTWEIGYEKSFSITKIKKIFSKYNLNLEEVIRLPIEAGNRFPLYGKILNIIEKPLFWIGLGGMHISFLARKVKQSKIFVF